jgi:hypothetical protein
LGPRLTTASARRAAPRPASPNKENKMGEDFDPDFPLVLIGNVLEHPDTGYIRLPPELIGTKEAAARYGVSERTVRRDCHEHGIAIMDGKTYLVAVPAADAFYSNDTGPLHYAQHDIEVIRRLIGWPISPSTPEGAQVIPVAWHEESTEEPQMQISFTPTQRYPETLRLKLPRGMQAVLQHAARRRAQSTSDFVRQILLAQLHQEGLVVMDTGAVHRAGEV